MIRFSHIYTILILLFLAACAGNKEVSDPIDNVESNVEPEKNQSNHTEDAKLKEKPEIGGEQETEGEHIELPETIGIDTEGETELIPILPEQTPELPPARLPETQAPDRGNASRRESTESPSPTQSPETPSTIDSSFMRKRVEGSLAHYIPPEMKTGEISHVELTLSSAISPEVALAKLNPQIQSMATTAPLEKLSYYMKAELIDYNAVGTERFFDIYLTGGVENEIQYLDLEDTTFIAKWDWAVKPLKAGKHPLQIKVSMNLDGKMSPTHQPVFQTLEVYSATVMVTSTNTIPITPTGSNTSVSNTSWKLSLVALGAIILLGTPLFFIFRKKRRKQIFNVQENDDHADPEEIMMLIRNGEVEKAVGELLDLAKIRNNDEMKNSIILQQTRWSHLEDDVNNGIISRADQQMERNKIHMALLHILDEMAE